MYWRCVQPIVEFLKSPDIEQGVYILDTQFGKINYVSKDISPVISTRINANNSYFVIEIMKDSENIIKLENYSPSGHNASTIVDPEGVAPTVMENHGTVTAVIEEAKVINPLKGQTSNGWHFEQQVYDEDGITRAVKAGGGSGNIPKVIEPYGVGRSRNKQGKICDLHLNDYTMYLHAQVGQARPNMEVMVAIPEVQQVGNIYPDKEGFKNRTAGRIYSAEGISPTFRTVTGGNIEPKIVEPCIGVFRGRNPDNPSERGKSNGKYKQRLEMNTQGTSNTITSVAKDNMVVEPPLRIPQATKQGYAEVQQGGVFDGNYLDSKTRRGRVQDNGETSPTIATENQPMLYGKHYRIRKLTPRECFRLQGVRDSDIDKIQNWKDAKGKPISNTQQYKMAGNSITVDVLYYIFKNLFVEPVKIARQMSIFDVL